MSKVFKSKYVAMVLLEINDVDTEESLLKDGFPLEEYKPFEYMRGYEEEIKSVLEDYVIGRDGMVSVHVVPELCKTWVEEDDH